MNSPNSGVKKSFSGNGIDPPHLISSLSPQSVGLYNYGGAGDAPSILPLDSTSIASGSSPLQKETISYNDYLVSHPQHDSSNVSAAMQDVGWKGGNENLTASNIVDAKALEKSQQQQRQHYYGNNSFTGNRAAAATIDQKAAEADFTSRDREKDRLIDSLSNSDMITCLPGFKNGIRPSAPRRTVRGPTVPSSAFARESPLSFSQIRNFQKSIDGGAIIPAGEVNPPGFQNSVKSAIRSNRRTPPPSPITRAQAAIGQAQSEISKIINYVENEEDRRKPPGAWKNMGTPFLTEPLTKSAQRQQKAQYRIDLERQIHASKLRKAEEERKERDSNDHPLGPEYAHPALTYYNPPQKITRSPDQGGTPSTTTTAAAAAITKYMKEKYALDIPGSSGGGGNTIGSYTSGYPQETGGSTTALGRIAPLQQTKKEKALVNLMKSRMHPGTSGNGDQTHGNSSRLLPMNQLQTGGTRQQQHQNGLQPGNSSRFPQQQQQRLPTQQSNSNPPPPPPAEAFVGHATQNRAPQQPFQAQQQQQPNQQQHPGYSSQQQQYAYPPGTYPPRPSYGANAAAAWPMPMYPGYPPYYGAYGQPMYSSANHGPVNSQQQQMQQQQQGNQNFQQPNYHHLSPPAFPSSKSTKPPSLRSILHDRHADEDSGADAEEDPEIDFEILKEQAYKQQKIWQTSDELPDPGLRAAVYKAELRKQIDEDRKRKAERVAREKEEDERIERKIREFHEEERRRLKVEQQTRAELDGYYRHKIESKQRKNKNEAFTITRHPERWGKEPRPRSRSSLLAEKLASFGPDAGDFEEDPADVLPYGRYDENEDSCEFSSEKGFQVASEIKKEKRRATPTRKPSPPVPVVQKKLIENFLLENYDENRSPKPQISSLGQDFLFELKSKLRSERDLVERRLQEKIESTHKNMNLLKYTMNQ